MGHFERVREFVRKSYVIGDYLDSKMFDLEKRFFDIGKPQLASMATINEEVKPWVRYGYKSSEDIFPIILMLHGGGLNLEDLRVIRND